MATSSKGIPLAAIAVWECRVESARTGKVERLLVQAANPSEARRKALRSRHEKGWSVTLLDCQPRIVWI